MSTKLIDYAFNNLHIGNPDGSYGMTIHNATVVSGPGTTPAGEYPKAVDLGSSGRASVNVNGLKIDTNRFTIRVVFQANGSIKERQNLVESNLLPFALYLEQNDHGAGFRLVASISSEIHGWVAASTQFSQVVLQPNSWYTASLVYDVDTLGLFIDEQIVTVHAVPNGTIERFSKNGLFVGTWVDGARNHFDGKIAGLQWFADIPQVLEDQLDEWRSHPEWFISHKAETVQQKWNIGAPTTDISYNNKTQSYCQHYENGAIMYHDSIGAAFEIHGSIYALYRSMNNKDDLGFLISDEIKTRKEGGRKSIFSKGAIYWSSSTGAVPVLGQIYLDYEALGESEVLGFPVGHEQNIPKGTEQKFEGARMYLKEGDAKAHEVHGSILNKYLELGGPEKQGFPVTNESDVKGDGGTVLGRFSEFEDCTIYWSRRTGAFEVHGDIREKYLHLSTGNNNDKRNGPVEVLGFPTSDESDIPGVTGPGRYNTFERGSILWYGSEASIIVARPFKIHLDKISTKTSEGEFWATGENDLAFSVRIDEGSNTIFQGNHEEDFGTGDLTDQNSVVVNRDINKIIIPNAEKTIKLTINVKDVDTGPSKPHDNLGTWTKELTMANGWGLRENKGILNSGSFGKIKYIRASIQPQIDINQLSELEKFWDVDNQGTDEISYHQYGLAFSNVDEESEWWHANDWLDEAFYNLAIDDLAASGNCFGMSIEAIYARKMMSNFSLPTNRFSNWSTLVNEFNIKHCYQLGAPVVYWFLEEFLTGNTHDPVDVFRRSHTEFRRGNNPVLCLTKNYDFTGSNHCVLPVQWNDQGDQWEITICDPSISGERNRTTTLFVNPDDNSFKYNDYEGSEWTGGRLYYLPFYTFNERPRAPYWDAFLLILSAGLVLLGDDGQTESITDLSGNDLNAYGDRAKEQLRSGNRLDNFFVQYNGLNQGNMGSPISGELYLQQRQEYWKKNIGDQSSAKDTSPLLAADSSPAAHVPISELLDISLGLLKDSSDLDTDQDFKQDLEILRDNIYANPALKREVQNRELFHLANDRKILERYGDKVFDKITKVAKRSRPGDFRHTISGKRDGKFQYASKYGLSEFRLSSRMELSERTEVNVKNSNTSKCKIEIKPDRDKPMKLEVFHKLGVGGDYINLKIHDIPLIGNHGMQLNLKPGFGGFEIMPVLRSSAAAELHVEINATIDGSVCPTRNLVLPITEEGLRLNLSTVLKVLEVEDKNNINPQYDYGLINPIDRIGRLILRKPRILSLQRS